MVASAVSAEQLKHAFELFNHQSDVLEASYRELQHKVQTLTRELKAAKSARLSELVKKERLSQRLSLLLETLPGAIVVLDGDGIIRELNSEATALLKEPLNGCSWASIVSREARRDGSEDGNIQLRDGRWLSLSRRPLGEEPGEILLLADVTDSRRMSDLRQRQERLSAIGEMTAEFAHQVRTPLASAMLYASQLEGSDGRAGQAARRINERLAELGRMVNDMLGFAAGGRKADETVELRALLTSVQATLGPQLAAETELELSIDGSDVAGASLAKAAETIAANRDALKGALINLVMNAEQAAVGPVRIELGAWRDRDEVWFTVTDDGPGIPDEVLPRLFEPFFTTRPQGTGLGLAVVREVAKAHGGEVHAESLRRGARFTIRLPVVAADPGASHD